MIDEKIHEISSFKQSKWLEKFVSFTTEKRNTAKNDSGKDFYNTLDNAFNRKTLENVRYREIGFY